MQKNHRDDQISVTIKWIVNGLKRLGLANWIKNKRKKTQLLLSIRNIHHRKSYTDWKRGWKQQIKQIEVGNKQG
jgi:hypothetical protein